MGAFESDLSFDGRINSCFRAHVGPCGPFKVLESEISKVVKNCVCFKLLGYISYRARAGPSLNSMKSTEF